MAAWSTCHRSCWVGYSYSITTLLSLWALRLVTVKIKYFLFVTWPLSQSIRWLCGWDPHILSHYPAKLGIHRSCESGDTTFFICHVTTWLICHVPFWVGSPHLKSPSCQVWGLYALWKWRYKVFYLSRDYDIKVSRDLEGGVISS